MPRRCSVFECNGNYDGEPYTPTVSASLTSYPEDREKWIAAMPNDRASLEKLSKINVCKHHFDCEWYTVQGGGQRPRQPPSIFPKVPKSCLKQTATKSRTTKAGTAEARSALKKKVEDEKDRITDFETFCKGISRRHKLYRVIRDGDNLYLSLTDQIGQKVLQFVHFKKVVSDFGFLFLEKAEKTGVQLPKKLFPLQKNSLLSKWSQVREILNIVTSYEVSNDDLLNHALESLNQMSDFHASPHFQFIVAQLRMLLTKPKGRRYDKETIVLAAELHNVSPAAYKMLQKSGAMALPSIKIIKRLLSNASQAENLKSLLANLKPQQKLVNVLFDEVKLTQATRFTGGHVHGHAENANAADALATHALVVELVCHHGGPKYVLRVIPVAKLNASDLETILLEAAQAVKNAGGEPVSFICDNCPTNQGVYSKMGGPGKVYLETVGQFVYLVFDYVHIFKNIRNNWITVRNQTLSFKKDGTSYVAAWSDIIALYEEDRHSTIRLTKLTHTSVYPKPLQRQSVPLVCQVFNEKTVAALKALKSKLKISEGTIVFVEMITNWFKMMNIKDKYSAIHLRDDHRSPWKPDCPSFKRLTDTCDVIATCAWKGGKGRTLKLTKMTSNAFVVSTKTNIEASKFLLSEKGFEYVLPAIWADELLEKLFGQARQRYSGNFYIDIVDMTAAANVLNLHNLLKNDILPVGENEYSCVSCTVPVDDNDLLELLHETTILETQEMLSSDDSFKHKIVYIAGHLVHKFGKLLPQSDEEEISTEFLDELNRGGLSVPTLSTVFFVHVAHQTHGALPPGKARCRNYLKRLYSNIDAPIANIADACLTLSNIILKAFVLNDNDRERELGCLRRKEKLSKT